MRISPGNRLRVFLLASLAINLFFVGLVGARMISGLDVPGLSHREDKRGHRGLPHPRALRAALPEQDHALLESTLDRYREDVRSRFRALNGARQGVADAIRATPFDPLALEAAFARLRVEDGATAESVHRMLGDLVGQLGDESRVRVAETIHIWRPNPQRGGEQTAGSGAERQ